LDKWDGSICATKGEAASHQAEDKEVDEGRNRGNSKCKGHWGGHAVEYHVERVADVLEDEEEGGGDKEAPRYECVDYAVEAKRDETER
jgi:hypothetical protein